MARAPWRFHRCHKLHIVCSVQFPKPGVSRLKPQASFRAPWRFIRVRKCTSCPCAFPRRRTRNHKPQTTNPSVLASLAPWRFNPCHRLHIVSLVRLLRVLCALSGKKHVPYSAPVKQPVARHPERVSHSRIPRGLAAHVLCRSASCQLAPRVAGILPATHRRLAGLSSVACVL